VRHGPAYRKLVQPPSPAPTFRAPHLSGTTRILLAKSVGPRWEPASWVPQREPVGRTPLGFRSTERLRQRHPDVLRTGARTRKPSNPWC